MEIGLETQLAAARSEVLGTPGVINLNAGTCSPTTRPVLAALSAWQERQARDPVEAMFRAATPATEAARRALAAWLACDPLDLLFFVNASYAVNTVLSGFPWQPGDEVLISDQEYHHYQPLLARLEEERGLTVRRVRLPRQDDDEAAGETPEPSTVAVAFEAAFTPRTRLVMISHVTSPTGTVLPAALIAAAARRRGIASLVDGSHAPGLLPQAETSPAHVGADFYCANIHKWMMGPASCAYLHVRREARPLLRPLIVMGGGRYDPAEADQRFGDEKTPTRFIYAHEYQGTRPIAPIAVVPDVLRALATRPEAAAIAWSRGLVRACRERLVGQGFRAVTPAKESLSAAMIAFRFPVAIEAAGVDTDRVWREFRSQHGMEILAIRMRDGTPLLRVSCAWFNRVADLDALARAVEIWRKANTP